MKTNTITTYICEHCGNAYDKMSDAAACEAKHVEEKRKVEAQEKRKKEIEVVVEKLSTMIQEYYNDYGEIPSIHIRVNTPPSSTTNKHCACNTNSENKGKNPIETILDTYFF